LGVDFFDRQLLDADPASNLLSWRWVAGLHTRGKHYIARAENIERNTLGRFAPYGQLDEAAEAIAEDIPLPPPVMPGLAEPIVEARVALLVTEEDLHPESWAIDADVVAIAMLSSVRADDPDSPVKHFALEALTDAAARAGAHFGVSVDTVTPDELVAWTRGSGVLQIVTAYAPVGPVADQLHQIEKELAVEGIGFARIVRQWDRALWPLATAGFFKLKSKLEPFVSRL